jgi:hypothetical protein
MIRNPKFVLWTAVFAAFSLAAISAHAQTTSAPIVIKSGPAPEKKPVKAHFEVLRMMVNAIQVRNPENIREIHTFTYSDHVRSRMQSIFNSGGFQYGDKVVIHYVPGTEVALDIQGKPSKPITP